MSIGVAGLEPGTAKIAEMGVALKAAHVIAAHCLLDSTQTCGTRRSVVPDIFVRGLVFFRQIGGILGMAGLKLSMPAKIADTTICKSAFAAYSEPISGGGELFFWCILGIHGGRV